MKLVDLLSMWKADSHIDLTKLDEDAVKTAQCHAKYQELFTACKIRLHKHKVILNKLKLKKRRYLMGKMTQEEMDELGWEYDPWKGESKPLKSDIDSYVNIQDDVIKINGQVVELEVMHDALVDILNNLNWRHSSVRNSIDFMKFSNGY